MLKPDFETSPLPESHRAELERRLADLDENPDTGSPWEEVRARLERHPVKSVSFDQPRRGVRN
jgi:putative addiction module component (TIGR02574 family)